MHDTSSQAELHPLEPFLPSGARILMSGSFPPPRSRWSMDWFYPNFINDMWRVWGLLAAGDKDLFTVPGRRAFDRDAIEAYCRRIGLALSDTAEVAVRLRGNASDKFLEVSKPRDIAGLLRRLPQCATVVLTGEKAVQTLGLVAGFKHIALGEYVVTQQLAPYPVKVWRMPSTSRAFPMPLAEKAEYYRRVLIDLGIDPRLS